MYHKDIHVVVGIYKITNKINGRIYIGKSNNIGRRWKDHIKSLKKKSHHNSILQEDWNEYGETSFIFEIETLCDESELFELEQCVIDKYASSNDHVYNITGVKSNDERGNYGQKCCMDIHRLIKDTREDYGVIVRFIAINLKLCSINIPTQKRYTVNRESICKALALSNSEANRTIRKMLGYKMLNEVNTNIYTINNEYIKQSYYMCDFKNKDVVLSRNSFIDVYENISTKEHKQLMYLLILLDEMGNNEFKRGNALGIFENIGLSGTQCDRIIRGFSDKEFEFGSILYKYGCQLSINESFGSKYID